MKLKELAEKLGAEVSGPHPHDLEIIGVAGVHEAAAGTITFVMDAKHLGDLGKSAASAALVPLNTPDMDLPLIRVKNPRLAFARALALFHRTPFHPLGVSDRAIIGNDVEMGADCSIHPLAVLSDRVRIGDRVTIHSGSVIGHDSSIGDDTVIFPLVGVGHQVSIGKRVIIHSGTVLGSDGFGFVTDGGQHHKIPQVGGVVIEDDVEIGANCSIDRATLGNTRIKMGTKLDNQVHVAHNVTIGEHCLIAGQVGIAGSSTLGNYVAFGGQVGVGDHVTIGDKVMAGGKSVIPHDIASGQVVAGFNAMPIRTWLKVQVVLPKLPELRRQILDLEKQVKELTEKISHT